MNDEDEKARRNANHNDYYKRITNSDGKVVPEHRYLMQLKLGRKLTSNEVVHHIDNIRGNNDIKNLKLMTISEHISFHNLAINSKQRIEKQLKTREKNNTINVGCIKPKLNIEQVKEIKLKLKEGSRTIDLAKEYNVGVSTIDNIKHNNSWRKIEI